MQRREFITLFSSAAAASAWPLLARAQQAVLPTIGYLTGGPPGATPALVSAFKQGLSDTGYVEGKNVLIEYRWANDQYDKLPALAADLVRHRVEEIVAVSPVAALAAKQTTTSIPIVFAMGSDPVRDGLITSLNHPGGNITGATFFGNLLSAKRLDLMHQLVPNANVIAVLLNPKNANVELETREAQEAATRLGLQLVLLRASSEREIDEAVANLIQQRATALFVSGDGFFRNRREQIAELAVRHSIPTSCPYRDQTVMGCLMSYGANVSDTLRQVGNYAGRILKGEKPADLPVQQPTKFEFVINLKTAKTLGLTIPPGALAIADEVIE